MNILPLAITAAGAIPSLIGGIMNSIIAGKKLSGGRLRRKRYVKKHKRGRKLFKEGKGLVHVRRRGGAIKKRPKRKHYKKKKGGRIRKTYKMKGRGVVADTLGSVPLLGMVLGPLAKAFGGKLARIPKRNRKAALRALLYRLRGKGLSPMYIRRPYVSSGCGLSPMYIRRPYTGGRLGPLGSTTSGSYLTPSLANAALNSMFPGRRTIPYRPVRPPPSGPKIMPVTPYVPPLGSLNPVSPYIPPSTALIPYTGKGLLKPAGGLIHRKGHLRKIKGKAHKIRVKPALVHGRGLLSPAGGYMPYRGHYGVYRH